MMCFFHKWGKWEQFERKFTKPGDKNVIIQIDYLQRRTCERCGKVKEDLIRRY